MKHVILLASQTFTIVGSGRVGEALANMGQDDVSLASRVKNCALLQTLIVAIKQRAVDARQIVIKRGENVTGGEGPIIVCTRNDDLQAVVDVTPENRRPGMY